MIYSLVCHPDTPPRHVESVTVQVDREWRVTSLIYMVDCELGSLAAPPSAKPYRRDGLWRTTCFEFFVRCPDGHYIEFNFAPSSEWAAYSFEDYRSGMRPLPVGEHPLLEAPPAIWTEDENGGVRGFVLGTATGSITGEASLALSAVIEEIDGTKSYWALAHAPGPPDFHNPACFTATLPPLV